MGRSILSMQLSVDGFIEGREARLRGCAPAPRDLRFPSYLPESSCDLFPVGDAIVVPTNES